MLPKKTCSRCRRGRPVPGQRWCQHCFTGYQRTWRESGSEAERVNERYHTDPAYREHRQSLARKSMQLTRLRRRAGSIT